MLKMIFIFSLLSFNLLADEEIEYLRKNAFKLEETLREKDKEAAINQASKPIKKPELKLKRKSIDSIPSNSDIKDLDKIYF